jgi:DNA-directed RNA polymerase specialized sigma24 family protein
MPTGIPPALNSCYPHRSATRPNSAGLHPGVFFGSDHWHQLEFDRDSFILLPTWGQVAPPLTMRFTTMCDPGPSGDGRFATTHWSLIVATREGGPADAREALAELCRAYWYPIYAYIRRSGHEADPARDLTQDFFAAWLERDLLGSVEPGKGRFRSYLLAACKHFLANRRQYERARKRGCGRVLASLDARDAEGRYLREPSHGLTAERIYERRWALTVLEVVLGRLGREMERAGKKPLFDLIAPALLGTGSSVPYARVASELAMTEGAVKIAAHRLRNRYRELLIEEVAATVGGREEVDDEIRNLFAALVE